MWDHLDKTLSMELGVASLSALSVTASSRLSLQQQLLAATNRAAAVCQHFMRAPYDGSGSPDSFVKERISFVEIAFRKKEDQVTVENANLDQALQEAVLKASRVAPGQRASPARRHDVVWRRNESEKEIRAANDRLNQRFESACRELNVVSGRRRRIFITTTGSSSSLRKA